MSLTYRSYTVMLPQAVVYPSAKQEGQIYSIPVAVGGGVTPLVAAVSGASIEVLRFVLSLSGGSALFEDENGTGLSGAFQPGILFARGGRLAPLFSTPNGKGLSINSNAGTLQGVLVYRLNRTS